MKQYLKYIITILIITFLIFEGFILCILKFPSGFFKNTYQSVIVDKYRLLQKTNEPKIIMVSGSSSAFGLDNEMLEKASGYKVINLGLHAGFGNVLPSELAKENINKGDIVLLGYEYNWMYGFDFMNQELVMTGIDDNIDLYKHIPIKKWSSFIGYILQYAQKKYEWEKYKDLKFEGVYAKQAFDKKTIKMIADREFSMQDYYEKIDKYTSVNLADIYIYDSSIKYLKDYKKYVEHKGAKIYFVAPPIYDKAVTGDYEDFQKLKQLEEKQIGIPYISNPEDYFFDESLMSNEIYHCNKEGEKKRTELLIDDLKSAKVIK